MMKSKVPFGTMLRATRLCYVYVEQLDCFIRFSDHGENSLVEIRPNDVRKLTGGEKKYHRVPDDPEEIIALSPVLRAITEVTKSMDFILDDDGELVGSSKADTPPDVKPKVRRVVGL